MGDRSFLPTDLRHGWEQLTLIQLGNGRSRVIVRAAIGWLVPLTALLVVAAVGAFCLQLLIPGDPAVALLAKQLGHQPTIEQVAAKQAELGLDQAFLPRLWHWLTGALHGDFGRSWATPGDVSDLVWPRIGATLRLGLVALALAQLLAMAGGIGAAMYRDRLPDQATRLIAALLACVPAFVLGVLVIEFIIVRGGIGRVLADGSFQAALLPGSLLGLVIASGWVRPVRAIALDVLNSGTVHTARARGASWATVVRVHVLPMVFLEFLPFLGLGVGAILGATTVMEVVFSWPGIGAYAAGAALHRDMPVLQAVVLLSVIAFRLGTDAMRAVGWILDPRRRSRFV